MPKSPCPPGQTRNRVTKSCRDKKKPGRKPGTRKAAGPKAKKVLFQVFLINNKVESDYDSMEKLIAKNAAKIIRWFKKFKDDYKDTLEIKGIKHKHRDVFELKYIGDDDDTLDTYLDSDEDGNHSVKINGIKYLISGERLDDDE
jgi:hypothetical protein